MKTSAKYFRLAVGPRSGNSSQKWPKANLKMSLTKNKTKNRNIFSLQTQRLAESFESLNTSLAKLASAEELCGW